MDTNPQPRKLVMVDATAEWLRDAADRHERNGEPVWALLYRNHAYRLERENSEVLR